MWAIFSWFDKVYQKIKWVINFVRVYISPIYIKLVEIIKEVKATDLENEAARKVVFQKITDYIQEQGIEIPDSILNLSIEIAYQLVKKGKD